MDPAKSAAQFFAGMKGIRGWEAMDIGKLCQKVQRSAYPDRYAKRVSEAGKICAAGGLWMISLTKFSLNSTPYLYSNREQDNVLLDAHISYSLVCIPCLFLSFSGFMERRVHMVYSNPVVSMSRVTRRFRCVLLLCIRTLIKTGSSLLTKFPGIPENPIARWEHCFVDASISNLSDCDASAWETTELFCVLKMLKRLKSLPFLIS